MTWRNPHAGTTWRNRAALRKADKHLRLAGLLGREIKWRQERRAQQQAARSLLTDVVLSLDTVYATQTADWQEGPAGQENVRQTESLRAQIAALEETK